MLREHIVEVVKRRLNKSAVFTTGFSASFRIPDAMVTSDKDEGVL